MTALRAAGPTDTCCGDREMCQDPDGERREMVELYVSKGLEQKDAEKMIEVMSKVRACPPLARWCANWGSEAHGRGASFPCTI